MTVECVSKWREGSIPSRMGGQQKLRIVGRNFPVRGCRLDRGCKSGTAHLRFLGSGPEEIKWSEIPTKLTYELAQAYRLDDTLNNKTKKHRADQSQFIEFSHFH
jgi:hypothetical protein